MSFRLSLIVFIALISCGDSEVQKVFYKNGSLKMRRELNDGIPHGESVYYFENGNKKAIEIWENGQLNGLSTVFYESGQVKLEVMYSRNEIIKQSSVSFYRDGSVRSEFATGLPIQMIYYEDGSIKEKQLFNSSDSLIDYVKYEQSGEVSAEAENSAFIDISSNEIYKDEKYVVGLSRNYDQWRDYDFLVLVRRNEEIITSSRIVAIDEDLGYYIYEYSPIGVGEFGIDMFFVHEDNTDSTFLHSTTLLVHPEGRDLEEG